MKPTIKQNAWENPYCYLDPNVVRLNNIRY